MPDFQLNIAKKVFYSFFFLFFFPSCLQFELVIDLISTLLQGRGYKSKEPWRKFNHANVFHCTIYVPHIFISVCRHMYWISQAKKTKKKHLRCFSNAVLGILFGDSVSFRSGSSVLGLRVHHSVRYNYEKLIPGRPVWHFIHDVSYGYLIHSSLTVHPHTYKSTHILQTQNFLHIHIPACWQLHEFGNRLGSFVPLVNNWIGLSQMHVH